MRSLTLWRSACERSLAHVHGGKCRGFVGVDVSWFNLCLEPVWSGLFLLWLLRNVEFLFVRVMSCERTPNFLAPGEKT